MNNLTVIKSKALQLLKQNQIKSHQIEEYLLEQLYMNNQENLPKIAIYADEIRRQFLEEENHLQLTTIAAANSNIATEKSKGIENKIGCITIPLGITTPMKITGDHLNEKITIPLATNEAALIAGINRAIKATNENNSITTTVQYKGMSRSVLLEFENILEARTIAQQLEQQPTINIFKETIAKHAEHTKFLSLTTYQIANKLWIRFIFNTGEAMGMNSATKYSSILVKKIKELYPEYKINLLSLSGNLCVDKKVSNLNAILGRGYTINAEITINEKTIKQIFNTTPEKINKLNEWKNNIGSSLAGTIGNNAQAANIIAAIFAATGQDLAQIGESSICFTTTEVKNTELHLTITLPSLTIGTLGGGCNRTTAKECLQILNCNKQDGNNTKKLAEIIGATVLCGELNLLATLTNEHELADSHIKLARGK